MEKNIKDQNPAQEEGTPYAPHRYHVVLCAEHFVFSDEVDKYEMLRRITRTGIANRYCVNGFILLDRELHLLLTADSTEAIRYVWRAYTEYCEYCRKRYSIDERDGMVFAASLRCKPVHSSRLLKELLDMHLLCVREGCVADLNAYWWSSFQTYRGAYRWPFLDTSEVFAALSKDRDRAICSFKRLQRARYTRQDAIGKSF